MKNPLCLRKSLYVIALVFLASFFVFGDDEPKPPYETWSTPKDSFPVDKNKILQEIQKNSKNVKQETMVPDDETILKWVENHPINREIKSIKCDFNTIEELFDDYRPLFGKSWQEIRKTKKCEDVLDFCMEKEEKRWKVDLDIITPEKGIETGNIIFYGHFVRPPFKIEKDYEKNQLKINGIILGHYSIPNVEQPKIKLSKQSETRQKRRFFQLMIEDYEKKLCDLFIQEINFEIIEWKKKKNHEEVYKLLVDKLEEMKDDHEIWDYKIYDSEKLLFDLQFYYSKWKSWDIPPEYKYSPEKLEELKQEYPERFLSGDEYKKWERNIKHSILENLYKGQILNINSDDYLHISFIKDGNSAISLSRIDKLLICLLSQGNKYQKIVYLSRVLSDSRGSKAKELVFNIEQSDLLYMFRKMIVKEYIKIEQ